MQTLNIYVAHPYDGHEENKKKVEEFIKLLIKKKIFHKPIIPKFEKIKMSKGCLIELGYAKHKGMEIIHWEDVMSINESN